MEDRVWTRASCLSESYWQLVGRVNKLITPSTAIQWHGTLRRGPMQGTLLAPHSCSAL